MELYAEAFERPAHWTSWKPSPASMARPSTTCRATKARSPSSANLDAAGNAADGRPQVVPLNAGETINWKMV
jgi:hypothetical protein